PEIEKHNPYDNGPSAPHIWLPVDVEKSHIAYEMKALPKAWPGNRYHSGEYPLWFSGFVNILGKDFPTEGLHFRSGYYAGSIILPSLFDVIKLQQTTQAL